LNGAASLDRPNREPTRISKAAHDPRLPLERARNSLCDRRRVGQVHHVDVSLRGANNQQLVLDIHSVHALSAVHGADRLVGGEVPVLDRLVPGAGREEVLPVGLEPAHAFDGRLVRFEGVDCDFALSDGGEVNEVDVALGVTSGDALAVLLYVSSAIYMMQM
jgi:hypothetical protein